MRRKNLLLTVAALAVLFLLPTATQADPISLVLDPAHTVTAGSSVTFNGSLSNGGAPGRFINSVSITFTGPAGVTFDDSPFFMTVPGFLAPGAMAGPGPFFTAMASLMTAPGLYTGSFSVLGGDTDSDNFILATQDFRLEVLAAGGGAPVPEPATLILLGSGLAGAAVAKRRRKNKTA